MYFKAGGGSSAENTYIQITCIFSHGGTTYGIPQSVICKSPVVAAGALPTDKGLGLRNSGLKGAAIEGPGHSGKEQRGLQLRQSSQEDGSCH